MMPTLRSVAFLLLLAAPALAYAQVGQVLSVQGTALVERAGKPARILGAGESLEQKDVINVAQGSYAILEFRDKTRITLRPNTVFRVETYTDAAPQAVVFGLSKGGFRAVTGDIAKQNPSAVRFQTDSVVLGIRGTEFDARLCENDCGEDGAKPAGRALARNAGRVIEVNGSVTVGDGKDVSRRIVPGAVLNEGETLATGPGSDVLVLFRDGSRVTLREDSGLAVTRFDFDEAAPGKGQARLKLLAGSAHVYTGQLAKVGPDAFLFETGAGVIRTVGAGFSVGASKTASGPAAQRPLHYADARGWTGDSSRTQSDAFNLAAAPDDVLVVHTWDGTIIIQTATERIEVPAASTLLIEVVNGKIRFLQDPPAYLTQAGLSRPDLVKIDPSPSGDVQPGLYILVRVGEVTLGTTGQKPVSLTAGNAARIADGGRVELLRAPLSFQRNDLTPSPRGTIPRQLPIPFRRPDGGGVCR